MKPCARVLFSIAHSRPADAIGGFIVMEELIDHLSTRDGYDRWASIYDDEGNPLIALEEPLVDQLLGDVRNITIADIGCGTGRHAVRLSAAGARVHAIDFSQAMLNKALAKAKVAGADITFKAHDLTQPWPLADGAFDGVVCGLVIDHIADLDAFFGQMRRICRPGGFAVVSVMHPAMMLRGVQARFVDPVTGRETRPQSQPNQISDYVMAATRAGFGFDHLSEHAVDENLAARMERARRYLGWPMLLMMRLRADS
jgi:malonyl-CoA O-methyltransferase